MGIGKMRIVLDTCVICRDFRMSKSAFRVFLDGLSRAGYSLHIPKLVCDEVLNKYAEELRSRADGIGRAIAKLERFTGHEFGRPLSDADLQDLLNEYTELLNAKFTAVQTDFLDYPDISHETLVSRALKRRKPFSESGKGYRDALIWETILHLATSGEMQPIAFISCNPKDFADGNGQLHPDLLEDIASLGEQCCEVVFFDSLEIFVDNHIKPRLEILGDIRKQLEANQYPNLRLDKFVEEELVSHVGGTELAPLDLGLPPEFETPSLSSVQGIYGIDEVDARQLSTGELLISLSASVDGEFDFFLFKADYYTLPEEERPFIWDMDWNEHYMAGSVAADVNLKLNFTFDTNANQVTSVQIVEITPKARVYLPIAEQWRAIQRALARPAQQWKAIQDTLDAQRKAYQDVLEIPAQHWKAIQEALDIQREAYQKALTIPSEQWKAVREAQKALAQHWEAIREASSRLVVQLGTIEGLSLPRSRDTSATNATLPGTGTETKADDDSGEPGDEADAVD